ncbi:MAG: hypothetical protein GC129_01495 [Proteobacteria bacterium]|nr:hypothetical protein [Pseudomonadota bacterium]
MPKTTKPAAKKAAAASPKKAAAAKGAAKARQSSPTSVRAEALKTEDAGYQLARQSAVKYIHGRRQAAFSLARHYHLDGDDLLQEAYEVLLTCLRDFNPVYTKAGGEVVTVQFNTFFGSRLEGKALEMRNRDPEYQARQAHMNDMSDADRAQFRENPPLLVQHLDQESTMQEHLRSEASSAQRSRQTNLLMKIAQDSFIERKLNDLIAAERDEKRRAALMHVKVGGVASFEEIAYHFGVTDSRASQILNELMDAFYVQRLLDADLKSVVYDFRKLGLNEKRAQRLLEEAMSNAVPGRAAQIAAAFATEYPELRDGLALSAKQQPPAAAEDADSGQALPASLTPEEDETFALQGVEWRPISVLTSLGLEFRPPSNLAPENLPHIRKLTDGDAEHWPPLLITPEGAVIDGERRIHAARAKGVDRLLCQVRATPSVQAAQTLRICLNARTRPLDKIELYFAIGALLTLGLSQGKIAEALGTSRPNVIVYAKVREKASPRLRQLFEDGLVQITNASTAVDLPQSAQEEMADFIRQHGASWGRGPQFTELYEAAAAGQIKHLAPAAASGSVLPLSAASLPPGRSELPPSAANSLAPAVANALKKRQEALETALRDAETWGKQREATIAQQTAQIQELGSTVESLKRELEAHALMSQADEATVASYLKEIKAFYGLQERLARVAHHLEKAVQQARSMNLSHRQTLELEHIFEKIATAQNALRVTLVKHPAKGG